MERFIAHMRTRKLSEVTIKDRSELIGRLADFLPVWPIEATTEMLEQFQSTYSHLRPASVDIYTRHIRAFYVWARKSKLILVDPAEDLALPKVPRTVPHPTSFVDLRTIFGCAPPLLRRAYVLASFTGLRCGEICRLSGRDITNDTGKPIALIHGKGGKDRRVPILAPVMTEIGYGRGWVLIKDERPVQPEYLSAESSRFLHGLGMNTTLHSMRATYATHIMDITHDPLLVRDLLGHESLETTQIYTQSSLTGVHDRIAEYAAIADGMLSPRHLTVVQA